MLSLSYLQSHKEQAESKADPGHGCRVNLIAELVSEPGFSRVTDFHWDLWNADLKVHISLSLQSVQTQDTSARHIRDQQRHQATHGSYTGDTSEWKDKTESWEQRVKQVTNHPGKYFITVTDGNNLGYILSPCQTSML